MNSKLILFFDIDGVLNNYKRFMDYKNAIKNMDRENFIHSGLTDDMNISIAYWDKKVYGFICKNIVKQYISILNNYDSYEAIMISSMATYYSIYKEKHFSDDYYQEFSEFVGFSVSGEIENVSHDAGIRYKYCLKYLLDNYSNIKEPVDIIYADDLIVNENIKKSYNNDFILECNNHFLIQSILNIDFIDVKKFHFS